MKIALLLLALSTAFAQPNTCGGLRSVKDGAKPVYPPIARAAQVGGDVILLVSFKTTGETDTVQLVSGPLMLQQGAVNYVKTWKANQYNGPRSCQVTITYIAPAHACKRSRGSVKRTDPQHVVVHSSGQLCPESMQ
jgi:hypothetical protein